MGAVSDFRARRGEYRFWGYEELTSADRWKPDTKRIAEAIMEGDWRWKGHPGVALDLPVNWDELCGESRSWSLALHSWEPLPPLLGAYEHTGDSACLEFALSLALDWLARFPSIEGTASSFAWYDLAVGSRAYRLAYLLDVVARDSERDDDLVALLLAGLRLHATALGEDERFARHSNHGFYQVMGQLAMARRFPDLPEIATADEQARTRLDALLDIHFTAEGVHREHSPHYHDLVLIPLHALQKSELIIDPGVEALCELVEDALAWFVTPAGHYAMFGDTSRQVVIGANPQQFTSPALEFALSGGRAGKAPDSCARGFPESGYIVFRDRWPSGAGGFSDCSYLAQACAFHSRVHKHADDLSFVWHDRGCEILTDAGRFGYVGKTKADSDLAAEGFWYSDPRRVYVESTRAHNAVETDGRSNPRRGVEPYGSALTQWGERGRIRFAESRLRHGPLSHTRLLLFHPRRWLLVVDSLNDDDGECHDFVQRFHLAPELDLVGAGDTDARSTVAELPSGDRLQAVGLLPQSVVTPARGVEQPELLGWISPRDGVMEPQWTFGWKATGVPSCDFAALFCFAQEPPKVKPEDNEVDTDACGARFGWEVDGERHSIALERTPGPSFEIEHSSYSPDS